ncbi:hypothetical protein Zmor_007490 [Zophobas morio]|uniref:Gustatory receptor n=1 Tax=Zophobas morio TaxID=2755281 RepID=A0AA38MM50_9CUCU|nr:hypothetical protein Zmor_007490 [Zophobas morio]
MFFRGQKKIPAECVICAARPALYLNQLNVYPVTFYCSHSTPPSRPHLVPSRTYKFLNILCCVVLIIGIINDLLQIRGKITTKHLLLILEILIGASTIIVNIQCLFKSPSKIQELHGLISLINKKTVFEVTEVLSASSAGKIYDLLLFLVLILIVEEVATFFRTVIAEKLDSVLLVRMFAIEMIIFCNISIAYYLVQFLNLYHIMFENCYEELRQCLRTKTHARLLTKLQKLQRFYMCLRRNFKLNELFFRSGMIIIYTIDVCLLLIGFSYLVVVLNEQDVNLLKFDWFVIVKSLALVAIFCIFCYEAERILIQTQNTLSLLFQCSLTKLSSLESAQVELIIQTFVVLKPNLNISYIFNVNTGLLASVCGTVITYSLVALQFRALLHLDEN